MTKTRVYIVFHTGRPMNFQALSELAGVEPTRIQVKGKERISKENSFEYHLPASRGKIVQRQYDKLMKAIKTPGPLGAYCKAHGIKVYVQVVVDGITDTYSIPVLHMDKKFIAFLADLNNAEVDFDIYTEPWDKEGGDYKKPAIILPSGEALYKI